MFVPAVSAPVTLYDITGLGRRPLAKRVSPVLGRIKKKIGNNLATSTMLLTQIYSMTTLGIQCMTLNSLLGAVQRTAVK